MERIRRNTRIALGLLLFGATFISAGTPARAVHPGESGGLTYPTKTAIRVHDVGGTFYDLPYAGASELAWTPDGRFLAFSLLAGEQSGIYLADSAGCDVQRLTTDPLDRAPAFDGVNMYFTRGTQSLQLDYDHEAEAAPVSGTPEPTGLGTDVAVSIIEGRWAHVEPPNPSHPEEYVLQLDDVFLRTETVEVFRSLGPITGTEWAPDGSVLAFEATADDGTTQIFAADVVGDPIEVEQLTDELANGFAPAFSPDGASMAWFRATDNRQSGIVYVRDLASGEDTFVTQQSRFGLDWQPIFPGNPGEPARPIETTTTVTLDAPSTGPGLHAFTVTVSPAPANGSVEVHIADGEPFSLLVDPATGTAQAAVELDAGTHLISARFEGSCPHRPSGGQASVQVPAPGAAFDDIGDSPFITEIEWLVDQGITNGCAASLFCPNDDVTREQMASFIARARDLPQATQDYFTDDDGTTHEDDINRLAEAGISNGCTADSFCPDRPVTREQMASFLARALALLPAMEDHFNDDDGRMHEPDINRIAEAQITLGCGPERFCPTSTVTREEMAAFLYRALS